MGRKVTEERGLRRFIKRKKTLSNVGGRLETIIFYIHFPSLREKEVRETRSHGCASCGGVERDTNTSKKPELTMSTDSATLLCPKHPFLICVTMPVRMAPDLQEGARSKTHLNKHTSELSGIRKKSSQADRALPLSSVAQHLDTLS